LSNIAEMPRASAPAVNEQQMLDVLRSSLYPGAADASIKLVLSYCKAAGLDPMAKPVHIVPMYDKKLGGMRDVVMPGIDLYRTKAARTGYYAGCSEPEFGPDVTQKLGGVEVTFPAWCRVTVRRIVPHIVGNAVTAAVTAEFTAVERWLENYATAKRDSAAPNAMWAKRPYGQLAKCAEAQALRKAFPEIGSGPTADEMAGKSIDDSQDAPSLAAISPLVDVAKKHAADGRAAFLAWWSEQTDDQRDLLRPLINELKTIAAKADAQAQAGDAVDATVIEQGGAQ
jgi:phage recombination protein Bet